MIKLITFNSFVIASSSSNNIITRHYHWFDCKYLTCQKGNTKLKNKKYVKHGSNPFIPVFLPRLYVLF